MKSNNRAISSVIVTSLLLVLTIFTIINFQIWIKTYINDVTIQTEEINSENIEIISLFENLLFLKSNFDANLIKIEILNQNETICVLEDLKIDNQIEKNLVIYLSGESIENGKVKDLASNIEGDIVNNVKSSLQNTIYSEKIEFGGVNDYLNFPNFINSSFSEVSVLVWTYFKENKYCYNLQDCTILNGGSGTRFQFTTNDAADFRFCSDYDSASCSSVADSYVEKNKWQFFSGVWNGTHCILYKNNTLIGTSVCSSIDNPTRIRFGQHLAGARAFNGSLDEIRFYNRSLNLTEIGAIYNAYLNATYLKIKEGVNNIDVDKCSLQHNQLYTINILSEKNFYSQEIYLK